MIILLFIITTLASNFLMLVHDDNHDRIKIISFNSQTLAVTTLFNTTLKTHPLDCKIDDFNNIYFFSLSLDTSTSTMNKFNSSTHELSSFEEFIVSIIIRDNIPYVTTVLPHHYHIFQLDWPNLTNIFTFEPYITLQDVALYVPSQKIFIFYAWLNVVDSIIVMTDDFKISQIYPINYQVAFICYHNNTIYTIIYGRTIQLCSVNLTTKITNCVVNYDKIAYYFYSGVLCGDTLYFVARNDDQNTFYWVVTDMINFTHTMTKLPFSLDIRCIKML